MEQTKITTNRQKKEAIVDEIAEKIGRSKALVFTNYQGLTHKQLEEFKKSLKTANAELSVVKNTLLKLSLEKAGVKADEEGFNNPTATIFAYEDVILPLKELAKTLKSLGLPTIKFGIMDGQALTGEDVLKLSALPSREVLLAQVVGGLKSPIIGLHRALNWNLQKLVMTLNAVVKAKPADSPPAAPAEETPKEEAPKEEVQAAPAETTEEKTKELKAEEKVEDLQETPTAEEKPTEEPASEKPTEPADAEALAGEEIKNEGGEN